MTITETLVAEHRVFCALFDFIDKTLPKSTSATGLKLLGELVEALLRRHAEAEDVLVLVALKHTMVEGGRLEFLQQEHKELGGSLRRVRNAQGLAETRRWLREAIGASRKHFENEERVVFPLLEKVLQSLTLTELNTAWLRRRKQAEVPPVAGVMAMAAAG